MRILLTFTVLTLASASAATFSWNNATASWSTGSAWFGSIAPIGGSATDELIFGGVVAPDLSPAASPPAYTATNDFAPVFYLNRLTLIATDPLAGGKAGIAHVITGGTLSLNGSAPQIAQNGSGPVNLTMPFKLNANLLLTGDGAGLVTFNRGVSGFADLTKNGASTFRFGTFPILPATTAPSENSWIGTLAINGGTFRFNNNLDSGRTALRANPIVFPASASGTPTLSCTSELRMGTLSGTVGKVESAVTGTNIDSEDIVITALTDGSFAGTVRLAPPTGTGNNVGSLVVRGPGVQTLTGVLDVDKDVDVFGSLTFGGTATLSVQSQGAVIMSGGTFRLDNTTTNSNDRLRDSTSTSTGLDLTGGGSFILDGHTAGTSETMGRWQLGAQTGTSTIKTKARSGWLRALVNHRATSAATVLTAQSYERDATTEQPLDTVEFSATNGSGTTLNLGSTGSNPRIVFTTSPTLVNTLLSNTTGTASTGWAVVKTTIGLSFATHGSNGIAAATTTTTWASSTSANVSISASQTVSTTTFNLNSLRIAPVATGVSVSIPSGRTLNTSGIILANNIDAAINGPGTLGGSAPRYVHVESAALTLNAALGTTQPLVKSGDGLLLLTATTNSTNTQILAINGGLVRAASGTTLPGGEIRFRGGVLELTSGGTFSRPLLAGAVGSEISGPGTVNWNTVELVSTTPAKVLNDRGSGGFAALGADVVIDLGAAGATSIAWEQKGFVQSGYALVFGSKNATNKVTLIDNLSLTSGDATINYNAREIRVDDNSAVTTDRAVISGSIGGTLHNDLLKTGAGTLELSGTNTFAGAAIVQAGTLVVSGSALQAIGVQVMNGATLAGSGSVTNILLESGGKLSPGDNTGATLTGTGLVWKAGGVCRFDLGGDQLNLGTGTLAKRGTGTYAFDFGGTGVAGQIYTLISFGSNEFARTDFSAVNVGASGVFRWSGNTLVYDTTTLTAIQQWRLTHFSTTDNAGTSANDADWDGDGVSNLLEYACGTSPTINTATPVTGSSVTNHLRLVFSRSASASGITLIAEAGIDLINWTTIATSTTPGAWTPANGGSASEVSGTVTITDGVDASTVPVRFLRLRVTQP